MSKWQNSGIKIETLEELLKQKVIYRFGIERPLNQAWILNQQVHTLLNGLTQGVYYKAILKEKTNETKRKS